MRTESFFTNRLDYPSRDENFTSTLDWWIKYEDGNSFDGINLRLYKKNKGRNGEILSMSVEHF